MFCVKKILLMVIAYTMVSCNAYAMVFSQPVKLGEMITANKPAGMIINGASYNKGKKAPNSDRIYSQGVARYGGENDGIYIYYPKNVYKCGKNAIQVPSDGGNIIYQIKTDNQMILYPISYGGENSNNYFILGRKSDGTLIKYIDTAEITQKYFGQNLSYYPFYEKLSSKESEIIITYRFFHDNRKGAFLLKWDERAQWFGIEHMVY